MLVIRYYPYTYIYIFYDDLLTAMWKKFCINILEAVFVHHTFRTFLKNTLRHFAAGRGDEKKRHRIIVVKYVTT